MVTNSPTSDMFIRLKNGYMAKNQEVSVPWSKLKQAIGEILVKRGYVESQDLKSDGAKKELIIKLKYTHKQPALSDLKIVSKPSLRVYVGKNDLPRVLGGLGFAIISTPMGLLTDKEARIKGLGGEVICEVW